MLLTTALQPTVEQLTAGQEHLTGAVNRRCVLPAALWRPGMPQLDLLDTIHSFPRQSNTCEQRKLRAVSRTVCLNSELFVFRAGLGLPRSIGSSGGLSGPAGAVGASDSESDMSEVSMSHAENARWQWSEVGNRRYQIDASQQCRLSQFFCFSSQRPQRTLTCSSPACPGPLEDDWEMLPHLALAWANPACGGAETLPLRRAGWSGSTFAADV